jgi:3-oxoacyl-[acyl-carrier protein] reductase
VNAVAHSSDISTVTGANELVDRAFSALGGLDFFVGNAGIWPVEDIALADMTDEHWRRTMAENVDSVFYTTRAAIRRISDDGRIVLVSSTAGQRGEAFHADYATSKGAMISLVKSLAPELGKRGITVNSVAPGCARSHSPTAVASASRRISPSDELPRPAISQGRLSSCARSSPVTSPAKY